ncbi:MAG: hypothetical protein ACR2N6_08325 [Miltoncostaeaceae bacterium]
MIAWYEDTIEATGRGALLWLLVAFLATFAITRWVTHRIRAGGGEPSDGSGLIGDIHIGGVHIHHVVWGILLMLGAGFLTFATQPDSPWIEILGAAFGAGAALTLDEFALWLHLDDVYWSEEGRKSVDAVVAAALVAMLVLVGSHPFGVSDSARQDGLAIVALVIGVNVLFALLTLAKGKLLMGVFAFFMTPVGIVGSIRLARPGSVWAHWRYRTRPELLERSEERYAPGRRPTDRMRDAIAGLPTSRRSD